MLRYVLRSCNFITGYAYVLLYRLRDSMKNITVVGKKGETKRFCFVSFCTIHIFMTELLPRSRNVVIWRRSEQPRSGTSTGIFLYASQLFCLNVHVNRAFWRNWFGMNRFFFQFRWKSSIITKKVDRLFLLEIKSIKYKEYYYHCFKSS